jgi:uridine kinase
VNRAEVIARLVKAVFAAGGESVTLVAIDGRSAAGKTTLADELVVALRDAGRTTARASIDDFHPPGHSQRSSSGGYTVESYYAEGFDYASFRECLLESARRGEACLLRRWDSYHDRPFGDPPRRLEPGSVLVVDGAFILRPDLRGYWDFSIWLHISFETMVQRALDRDIAWMPSREAIEKRYGERWVPLHNFYEAQTRAPEIADALIDNTDPANPRIVRLGFAR